MMHQMQEMLRGTLLSKLRAHKPLLSLAAAGTLTVSLGLVGCQTQDPHRVEHHEFDDQPPVQEPQQQPAPAPGQQQPGPAPGQYR